MQSTETEQIDKQYMCISTVVSNDSACVAHKSKLLMYNLGSECKIYIGCFPLELFGK